MTPRPVTRSSWLSWSPLSFTYPRPAVPLLGMFGRMMYCLRTYMPADAE